MALDNAQFISELSITDPPGTDAVAEGDDHIRTTKRATQQSFPNVDAAVPQTAAQMGQMAIKNEVNVFTQANTFQQATTLTGRNIITRSAGNELAGFQFRDQSAVQQWELYMATDTGGNVNALALDRYIAGVFQDTPIIVSNVTGQVDFSTEVHGASRFQLNNANFVQSHSGDRGFAYEDSVSGETEWIMQARGTSKNWRLRRFTAGAEVDTPISVDFVNGRPTFANICFFGSITRFADGNVISPSLSFTNAPDLGFYHEVASNVIACATGGEQRWRLSASSMTVNSLVILNSNGGPAGPGYSFRGDTDTGMYRVSENIIGFASGAVRRMQIKGNTTNLVLPTSNAGLLSGDLFISSGFVAIVP